MGVIDWPSPYLSNTIFYKAKPTLPNGEGSTRRYNIPNQEAEVVGVEEGDKLSCEMYDIGTGREVAFQTEAKPGSGNVDVRFTVPLRELDLRDKDFSKRAYTQLVIRKTGLLRSLPVISPERVHKVALFKRRPSQNVNPGVKEGSTLRVTIPISEVRSLNILNHDRVDVTVVRVDNSDSVLGSVKDMSESVSRGAFRANLVSQKQQRARGPIVSFNIPAKRRRLRGYDTDTIYQFAVRPVR